jgi:hypothetical protein
MMRFKARASQNTPTDCAVQAGDLRRLPLVKQVLSKLNDPYTGAVRLADLVEQIPALAARCRREAHLRRPTAQLDNMERTLMIIGNKGLEKALLELLEDLTVLKSELER